MFRFDVGQTLRVEIPPTQSPPHFETAQKDHGLLRIGPDKKRVTIKSDPAKRLEKEAQMLRLFQGCDSIRQLVDQTADPESLVLEYMDNNALDLLKKKQLPRIEAKRALKAALQALAVLHDNNIVHTDVKPDNILVKNSALGPLYKLGDLGDASPPDVVSNDGGHLIGAEIFCAPEVPLGIPWTTKAGIWGLGATGITLVDAPPSGDTQLSLAVLQIQNDFYGPISIEALKGLADDSILPLLRQFEENYQAFPLSSAPGSIRKEDVDFFGYVMRNWLRYED
ncbi:kinase-like domain-containing protein [Phialemonium atrogriseum]|uniref:Kinase-like domain-containing protein n=1 Tax=Phialemonium atrogriseum TaxID=1093897 RepID=A0AAJ0C848_9PEZI|nr:kinase-like domain-containing protein [Phialemonium atrogriseum]KAK1770733.1 kinase-like domain-containing protein [Phialemonium atrogriseum]